MELGARVRHVLGKLKSWVVAIAEEKTAYQIYRLVGSLRVFPDNNEEENRKALTFINTSLARQGFTVTPPDERILLNHGELYASFFLPEKGSVPERRFLWGDGSQSMHIDPPPPDGQPPRAEVFFTDAEALVEAWPVLEKAAERLAQLSLTPLEKRVEDMLTGLRELAEKAARKAEVNPQAIYCPADFERAAVMDDNREQNILAVNIINRALLQCEYDTTSPKQEEVVVQAGESYAHVALHRAGDEACARFNCEGTAILRKWEPQECDMVQLYLVNPIGFLNDFDKVMDAARSMAARQAGAAKKHAR